MIIVFPEEYQIGKVEGENPICEYISSYDYIDEGTTKQTIYKGFLNCQKLSRN